MISKIAPLITAIIWLQLCVAAAESIYVPPASSRVSDNFNPGWKFIREDVLNAEQVVFDDSKWSDVSAPHAYNDVDSYNVIISHKSGDRGAGSGITWYRKHFKLPAGAKDDVYCTLTVNDKVVDVQKIKIALKFF